MKEGIVMNYLMNDLTNTSITIALKNNMKNQLEGDHINELQEWEGLSSG
jgi:hypothetical protein